RQRYERSSALLRLFPQIAANRIRIVVEARSVCLANCANFINYAVACHIGSFLLDPHLLSAATLGALASVLGQDLLAEPDLRRGDLDELVVLDVLEGQLQGQFAGWFQ